MASGIEICQKACVLVGISPITSFSEGTTESIACDLLYEDIVNGALSEHPWSFGTKQFDITANRISTDPDILWDARYQLPVDESNFIGIHGLFIDGSDVPASYDRYEDDIYCNAGTDSTVVIKMAHRPDENDWPYYFRLMVIYRMALNLAISVTRNPEVIAAMQNQDAVQTERAKTRDSQSRTAKKVRLKKFASRRY